MRIDLVITELDTGGAERCCASLAIHLAARGHRVRVIAFGPEPPPSKVALLQAMRKEGIETHFLNAKCWWMFPLVISKFRQLLRVDTPDVVQSFLWHANVLSALVVPSFRIPLVGGERVAEPSKSRHFSGAWAAKRMAKVVCVSEAVKKWCSRSYGIDDAKLEVIPNGISLASPAMLRPDHELSLDVVDLAKDPYAAGPLARSTSQESNLDKALTTSNIPIDTPVLLFVGRLTSQKGLDVLLERAPKILGQLPEHHLVLLGDGPFRDDAERIANLPELNGRMHVLGQRDDVREWMRRSQLLLLPSRYEGMPNVVLEAMAEGLPVITTRVEGVADLLDDQLEAQTVEAEDWDAWTEKLLHLVSASELRSELGDLNQNRAIKQFDLEKQLAKYEVLYKDLVRCYSLKSGSS